MPGDWDGASSEAVTDCMCRAPESGIVCWGGTAGGAPGESSGVKLHAQRESDSVVAGMQHVHNDAQQHASCSVSDARDATGTMALPAKAVAIHSMTTMLFISL